MKAESEIRAAFDRHFAGEARVYVPRVRTIGVRPAEVGEPAREALESVADYREPLAVWHALLLGDASVAQYRAALVAQYIAAHAEDVDEHRAAVEQPALQVRGEQSPMPDFIAGAV